MSMPRTRHVHDALAAPRARLAARDADIVSSQVAICEIPAPTGDEQERGAWMASRFRALGLVDVRTDTVGNVIGRRPGAVRAAPVVICAHLDTVFPRDVPLRVRRDGRRLAVMLALAEAIDGARLRTRRPVEFVATVGEEGLGDLRGAKRYFADAPPPAAVIVIDGAGDERVVHRALGSRRFRVSFSGPGGHSWAAFGVPNAIHAAASCAARLAATPLPDQPRATLTVARIGGGMSVNAIPRDAWLEVDTRSSEPAALHALSRAVYRAARDAAAEENARRALGTPPLAHAVETIGDRPCGVVPEDDPLVRAAVAATRLVGRRPELATASTDANVPIGLGVPAVAIGAGGRGGDAHTPGEWYENVDGSLGVARALTLTVASAGLA